MHAFDSRNRTSLLTDIQAQPWDLLVIGGGATGAGIALDAASRGLKTLLIEKNDFASGTSSRSTKLIHGGLRYLKQFEVALVREVGRERAIVHRLAPHLVVSEKMLLPLVENGTYGKMATAVGLMVYDVLAGVEKPDQRIMLSREETLAQEPLLKDEVVEGAGYYAEYRTDDARLTVEVLKTAAEFGARPLNYTEVTGFMYADEKVSGAECTDLLSGKSYAIEAKQVVSATGPWVDELRDKDGSLSGKRLHLTKGVHIVIPRTRMPLKQSVYYDVPDGRMLFAIPRGQITYIGTTDTDYHGDKHHPRTLQEDVAYLIKGTNNLFPQINLRQEDVVSSWAGLRPLIHEDGKSASELSRKDEIFISETGLISIAGGKLTGYRKMAERTVDAVLERINPQLDQRIRTCYTDKIDITGGKSFPDALSVDQYRDRLAARLATYGLGATEAWYLVHNYGDQCDEILNGMEKSVYSGASGMIDAELRFGVAHEMVHSSVDFFSRRTGRLYFAIETVRAHRDQVLQTLADLLDWDQSRMQQEEIWLDTALEEASIFPESVPA